MRKIMFCLVLISPLVAFSQLRIGLKAGLNFANVTNASSINSDSRSGYLVGIFLAPSSHGVLGSRTELEYSRQGYNFKSGTNTGNVNLDYLIIPQLMSINITKYFSLQLGAQMAFLLNAKADSTSNTGSSGPYGNIMSFYNKIDYGFAGGVEIHPYKGLLIGARYNLSLGNLYKDPSSFSQTGGSPSPADFIPKVDVKNNVVQIFVGWIFGKNSPKKK